MKIYCANEPGGGLTAKDIQMLKRQAVGKDCWVLFAGYGWHGCYLKILDINHSEIVFLGYSGRSVSRLLAKFEDNPSVTERDIIDAASQQKYPIKEFMRFNKLWTPFEAVTTEELATEINDLIRRAYE